MALQTLFDLYKNTGEKLAGRGLILKFQRPYVKAAPGRVILGAMLPLADGRAFVEITPGLEPDKELETFLHEIAHVRIHYGELGQQPAARAMARTGSPYESKRDPATKSRQETQADELAAAWLAYANCHGRDLESKLWALLKNSPEG